MSSLRRVANVLRTEGAAGIGKRLRRRWHRLMPPKVVKSAYGIDLSPRWGDKTFELYVRGAYGRFLTDLIERIDEPFVFVDIGANQGLYSILASRNQNCRHVYAFEPVDDVAGTFDRNIALNKCRGITLIRKAISDSVGSINVVMKPGHSGVTTLRRGEQKDSGAGKAVAIATIDAEVLNAIVPRQNARVVTKIDVEGHEGVVIEQLAACDVFEDITDVFYEVDERWVCPDTLQGFLTARGFTRFQQIGKGRHFDVLASRPGPDADMPT